MNKTFRRILIWGGSIVIVFAIAGYFIMDYAVNRMLNSFTSEAMEIEINNLPEEPLSSSTDKDKESVDGDNVVDTNPSIEKPQEEVNKSETGKVSSSTKPNDDVSYSAEVSLEKAEVVKESVTVSERLTVASVLLKRFNTKDIELLTSMASGGLNLDEKSEAKKIFLEKLSEEEYNKLIAIAAKHGLSEGKKYNETSKE